MLAPKDEKKCNEMSSNPILLVLLMPFEGQLKPPSFLVSKGTKYSKKKGGGGGIQITAFLLIASLSFFLLLIVSCLLGSQTC